MIICPRLGDPKGIRRVSEHGFSMFTSTMFKMERRFKLSMKRTNHGGLVTVTSVVLFPLCVFF